MVERISRKTSHRSLQRKSRSGLASFSAQVPYSEDGRQGWGALWGEDTLSLDTPSPQPADTTAQGETRTQDKKRTIFVSRDYRYLSPPSALHTVISLLIVLAVVLFYVFFYGVLSNALCVWAGKIVEAATGASAYITSSPLIPHRGPLYFLAVEGTLPSFSLLIVTTVVCLLLAIFSIQSVKNTLPAGIYVCMAAYLALVSVLFFLFWPDAFPYTLTEYSELYMKQQIVLWLFIPMVGAFAVFMVDKKPLAAGLTFAVIAVVSFIFGCVRYPIYLVVLHLGSSLFMAPIFFTLGVLFDFLQMIAIYVIYIRYLSGQLESKANKDVWQW